MNQHERLAAMREAIALLDRVVTAYSTAPFDDVLVSAPMNTWRIGRIGAAVDVAAESLRRAIWNLEGLLGEDRLAMEPEDLEQVTR